MSKIILVSENGLVIYLGDKSKWKELEVTDEVFEILTIDPIDPYSSTSHEQWKPVYDGEQTIEEAFELPYD
tara:strand:+ start:40 stop:252 length:213 start_codon:yes stop_codon:yes gene_type:complete